MSEKELRERVAHSPDCRIWDGDYFCTCDLGKLLSQRPDVVRAADRLLDLAAGEELGKRLHWRVIRAALQAAARDLQQYFGFHYIPEKPGWEWTEKDD